MPAFWAALLMAAFCFTPARPQPSAPAATAGSKQAAGNVPSPTPHQTAGGKSAPVYHLLGFGLSGTKRVNTDALINSLPQHEGDVITQAQIKADAEIIGAALKAHHVHGDMTTATMEREGKGHYIWVIWDVHLVDPLARAPYRGVLHFASQSFSGNVKLSADKLAAATGLHPGDKMPDGTVSDARTGIEQAYDSVLPGAPVQVKGKVIVKKDNNVVINWVITEPK